MRLATGLFYKQVLHRNLQLIPSEGPVLLICNHPSSLMDAAILGVLSKRPLHFFARGDLFASRFVTWILNALHMHPVFQHREGRTSINNNDAAFETAHQLLMKGEVVLFFPEGISQIEYRLQLFKKGAFRIAQRAATALPNQQLVIIPIGINYSHPTKVFSRVWVQAGQPLMVESEADLSETASTISLKQLTDKGRAAIETLVPFNNDHPSDLHFFLDAWRKHPGYERTASDQLIEEELKKTAFFNANTDKIIPKINALKTFAATNNIAVTNIVATQTAALPKLPLYIGFPAASIGWLTNALPILIAKSIADKKVTRSDFYSWVLLVSAAFLYIIWILAIAITAIILLPLWKAATLLFCIIATGLYSWNYYHYFLQWKEGRLAKKEMADEIGKLFE